MGDESPLEYLLRLHPRQRSKQEAVRGQLLKFGVAAYIHLIPIAKLSKKQRVGVVFTGISMRKPHLLVLDEPTNHLDIESIDSLGEALDRFVDGVVLVSQDVRLITRVCEDEEMSQILVVDDGSLKVRGGHI